MPTAVEPGKGAVPVNPFIAGRYAGTMPIADMAEGAVTIERSGAGSRNPDFRGISALPPNEYPASYRYTNPA